MPLNDPCPAAVWHIRTNLLSLFGCLRVRALTENDFKLSDNGLEAENSKGTFWGPFGALALPLSAFHRWPTRSFGGDIIR